MTTVAMVPITPDPSWKRTTMITCVEVVSVDTSFVANPVTHIEDVAMNTASMKVMSGVVAVAFSITNRRMPPKTQHEKM